MSRLIYNGVTLDYILTKSINQEAVYGDPDQQDYLYTKFTIELQALINPALLPSIDAQFPQLPHLERPAWTMDRVRFDLLKPRKLLQYYAGDTPADLLIESPPLLLDLDEDTGEVTPRRANRDDNNGPFPKRCTITKISGSQTYLIDYVIETCINECPPQPGEGGSDPTGGEIVYHRWSDSFSIDRNQFQIRTRRGKLRVRGRSEVNPDTLRLQVVPSLPDGYQRIQQDFAISPDALTLEYVIVDQQKFKNFPYPATDAKGDYTETSSHKGGVRWGEVRVHLTGPPGRDETIAALLVRQAIGVAVKKVFDASGANKFVDGTDPVPGPNQVVLENSLVRQSMWSNECEVALKVLLPWVQAVGEKPVRESPFALGTPFSQINGVHGVPSPYGTNDLRSELPTIGEDPCNHISKLETIDGTATLVTRPTPVTRLVATLIADGWIDPTKDRTVLIPAQGNQPATLESSAKLYTDYKIHSFYDHDHHGIQMPLATDPATGVATCAVVDIASPTLKLVVEWQASRLGSAPQVPPYDPPDTNHVLLRKNLNPTQIDPEGGVTPRYTITGKYEFAVLDPTQVDLTYPVGPHLVYPAEVERKVGDEVQLSTILFPVGIAGAALKTFAD